jgi:FixJ family two-component response regulator
MDLEISQSRKKVLVVDDDISILRLIETMANPSVWDIKCVLGAEDAVRLIDESGVTQYQAIVVDYHMPKMDGLDLLEYVRKKDPSISAIIMTAEHDVDVVTRALRFGACDFIHKPFRFQQLINALEKGVRSTSEQRHLAAMASEVGEIIGIHDRINSTSNLIEQTRYMDRYSVALETIFYPIEETGGDFAHCFPISDERLLLVIGDVSGHDLTAGFISSYFRGMVRGMVYMGADIKTICEHFNNFLVKEWNGPKQEGMMTSIAVCFMLFDFKTREIRVVSQGFPNPWMGNATAEIQCLSLGTQPLGWFEDMPIEEEVYPLPDSGTCLLWSDGLLDLAEDQELCPFSLAHYIFKEEDRVQRDQILQKRKDDIVVMRISWHDEIKHMEMGQEWRKCQPIYLKLCKGGDVDKIDELQASWKRCLGLMFPVFPEERLHEITLATREALLNAMLHGCKDCPDRECKVQIAFDADSKMLLVRVDDEGCGYEAGEQDDCHGDHVSLGLQIIQFYADKISLSRNGAALTMHFDLSKEL